MLVNQDFSQVTYLGAYPYKPHFPFAHYYNEEAERVMRVYLQGRAPMKENVDDEDGFHLEFPDDVELYNPERHDGNLTCPGLGCCAELHVNAGKDGKAGNPLLTQSPHLKTNSDSSHREDCKFKAEPREAHDYDDTLGLRVHLNLKKYLEKGQLSAAFQESASIYFKGDKGHPKLKAEFRSTDKFPHLEDMRSFEIHEPKNFLTLVRRGNFERLKESAFINHDHVMTDKEFLVRYSRKSAEPEHRFINLFSRLLDMKQGKFLPCLMEFQLEKGMAQKPANENHSVVSKPIFYYQEQSERGAEGGLKYDGPKHYLIPRVKPGEGMDTTVQSAFADAGRYLVLGYVSLSDAVIRDKAIIHYMDIQVLNTDQVLKADLGEILQKTLKKRSPAINADQSPNPV